MLEGFHFTKARSCRFFVSLFFVLTVPSAVGSNSESARQGNTDLAGITYGYKKVQTKTKACVVLLHGLAGSSVTMKVIEHKLERLDYQLVNIGYPSRSRSIKELAPVAIEPALAECEPQKKIHFVTHSMGGILLRQYLSNNALEGLGKVVMLAPPNQGNPLASSVGSNKALTWYFGPALNELADAGINLPDKLGPVEFNLGVIAGTRSHNPFGSRVLPGVDDGAVSVEQTKVQGMNAHTTVKANHLSILFKPSVYKQIVFYLQEGRFIAESHSRELLRSHPNLSG